MLFMFKCLVQMINLILMYKSRHLSRLFHYAYGTKSSTKAISTTLVS